MMVLLCVGRTGPYRWQRLDHKLPEAQGQTHQSIDGIASLPSGIFGIPCYDPDWTGRTAWSHRDARS
jgi:hypothetical protein